MYESPRQTECPWKKTVLDGKCFLMRRMKRPCAQVLLVASFDGPKLVSNSAFCTGWRWGIVWRRLVALPKGTMNEASRITTLFLIIQCTQFSILYPTYNIDQSRKVSRRVCQVLADQLTVEPSLGPGFCRCPEDRFRRVALWSSVRM